jgi:uncharacterized protein
MISFEWDDRKAEANLRKHDVPFEEAKSCFLDVQQVAFFDPDHSEQEDRELLVGHSDQARLLLVSYVLRGDVIRIISARKATTKEVKRYAQGI